MPPRPSPHTCNWPAGPRSVPRASRRRLSPAHRYFSCRLRLTLLSTASASLFQPLFFLQAHLTSCFSRERGEGRVLLSEGVRVPLSEGPR